MKTLMNKIALSIGIILSFSNCLGDLDRAPINPNVVQNYNQDALFGKIYATLALTGSQGPSGMGDVAGIDEGTSSFFRTIWSLNQFGSDESWWVWTDVGVTNIRDHSWDSSNDLVEGLYGRLYFDINLCNFFLKQTEGKTDEKSLKQIAEVRFIRALNFYYLMDLFGEGVPFATGIIDEVPVDEKLLPEPISRKDLFAWIEKELKDIEMQLFDVGAKPAYYRIDRAASWLLLARIYLNAKVYTGSPRWNEAAEYAAKVMNSSYTLAPVYRHLFMADNDKLGTANKASQEIILAIAQEGQHVRSWGGSLFLIAASHVKGMTPSGITEQWECFRAKNTLVQKFFPDLTVAQGIKANVENMPGLAKDERCLLESFNNSVKEKKDDQDVVITYEPTLEGGASNGSEAFKKGWGIAKFSNLRVDGGTTTDTSFPDMDIAFMRAAEAYLTYAEALLRGGAPQGGKTALDAVNHIRNRAKATLWTDADLTLDKLLDEWSREFYCEGRRRSDLVRFGKFGGAEANYNWEGKGGSPEGKNIDEKYNIYPIPLTDLVSNKKLKPSQGY